MLYGWALHHKKRTVGLMNHFTDFTTVMKTCNGKITAMRFVFVLWLALTGDGGGAQQDSQRDRAPRNSGQIQRRHQPHETTGEETQTHHQQVQVRGLQTSPRLHEEQKRSHLCLTYFSRSQKSPKSSSWSSEVQSVFRADLRWRALKFCGPFDFACKTFLFSLKKFQKCTRHKAKTSH